MVDVDRNLRRVPRCASSGSSKQTIRNFTLAVFAFATCIHPTIAAGPFSQLIVFGDSLSDVGNIQAAIGIYPGDGYYNGRFSNGPVFVEGLSAGLGLGPSIRSSNGGDNFAYGGAKTAGTTFFQGGSFIDDINEQVTDYLPRATDPNALFLIFAGANDLLGSSNVTTPVNNLATDINRLISDGAQSFLVLNLPLLGYTPRYNDSPSNFTTFNNRTQQFNAALATMLDGLEASNPAIEILQFDVAALFNDAIANPQWFGLTNVTDPAAPGLAPGMSSYDESQIVPNENEYVFWDDLHPTATVHAILAERVQMHLATPGDFNRDNTTDAADYVAWRKRLGSVYTPPDVNTWIANFGGASGTGGAAPSGTLAPEPSCFTLLASVAAFAFGFRRRYI